VMILSFLNNPAEEISSNSAEILEAKFLFMIWFLFVQI